MNRPSDNSIRVLAAGRTPHALASFEQTLCNQPDIDFAARHIVNGTIDPLQSVRDLPDVLVLHLSGNWRAELAALRARPLSERPPIIVVSDETDAGMMREAMNAGVRDFLSYPCPPAELLASVHHLANETRRSADGGNAHLTAVINAKGGSGASFIACNLGHMLASELGQKTALIDLDLQFGTLPLYLDISPRTTLMDALAVADELDGVALEGYMARHSSGLHLLPAMSEHLGLPWEIPEASLSRLLNLASGSYDQLIIDLPRQIDPLTSSVIERADSVLVVMQQSLTHIRDAKRLLQLISNELGVPRQATEVVVNRYNEKHPIALHDIREAVQHDEIVTLPNDFNRVSESVNTGRPLLEMAKGAALTRTLERLARRLSGTEIEKHGVLQRAVSYLFT
jgi:pilus assembly protein CpaE